MTNAPELICTAKLKINKPLTYNIIQVSDKELRFYRLCHILTAITQFLNTNL